MNRLKAPFFYSPTDNPYSVSPQNRSSSLEKLSRLEQGRRSSLTNENGKVSSGLALCESRARSPKRPNELSKRMNLTEPRGRTSFIKPHGRYSQSNDGAEDAPETFSEIHLVPPTPWLISEHPKHQAATTLMGWHTEFISKDEPLQPWPMNDWRYFSEAEWRDNEKEKASGHDQVRSKNGTRKVWARPSLLLFLGISIALLMAQSFNPLHSPHGYDGSTNINRDESVLNPSDAKVFASESALDGGSTTSNSTRYSRSSGALPRHGSREPSRLSKRAGFGGMGRAMSRSASSGGKSVNPGGTSHKSWFGNLGSSLKSKGAPSVPGNPAAQRAPHPNPEANSEPPKPIKDNDDVASPLSRADTIVPHDPKGPGPELKQDKPEPPKLESPKPNKNGEGQNELPSREAALKKQGWLRNIREEWRSMDKLTKIGAFAAVIGLAMTIGSIVWQIMQENKHP